MGASLPANHSARVPSRGKVELGNAACTCGVIHGHWSITAAGGVSRERRWSNGWIMLSGIPSLTDAAARPKCLRHRRYFPTSVCVCSTTRR